MIAGVDEAGRGCLAGPVVAAAVILDPQLDKSLFKDSKLLSEQKRDVLFSLLNDSKSFIGLGVISNQEIDKVNILNATMLAMKQAIVNLSQKPIKVIVDGNGQPWVVGNFPVEEFQPGEWYEYRVLAEANRHRHWINDHPTTDVIDLDENAYGEGLTADMMMIQAKFTEMKLEVAPLVAAE